MRKRLFAIVLALTAAVGISGGPASGAVRSAQVDTITMDAEMPDDEVAVDLGWKTQQDKGRWIDKMGIGDDVNSLLLIINNLDTETDTVKTTKELFDNIVTKKKDLTESALHDMMLANIILKYTQSNSVCYVKDGQAIGIGAGQQSRIHCTRLAGDKADKWFLRQSPKALNLPFRDDIRRPDRDNTIDVYLSDDDMDVLADGIWENFFTEKPERMTREERAEWIKNLDNVTLGSDAFIPFSDNVERANRSGVKYIAQAGGSKNDQAVIDACDEFGITMAFTGLRLFHH